MVARFLDAGHRAAWVAGDEVYGGNPTLRTALEERGTGYVLAVACSHEVTTGAGKFRAEETRVRVELAIAELGFVRGGAPSEHAAHWRRNGFATWLFTPAVSGWYPKKAPQEARPVPILGEPWPGIPARGRGATDRADACWLPIAKGLTPHGLRHTHRTMMEDVGTEKVLMDERMGHIDGYVSARYAHVPPACAGVSWSA